ncbi:MAG: glutamate--tRNA ligase [Bdellovibrionales bacterium]|nr:glutamate--tRNA ligase [Bdellovibrionales bacterium]
MTSRVRTRFAPSPTGFLHIGGFRSAFYAWLLARHCGGDFILRIEDTDQARKVPGAVQLILEGFRWFGIDIDEGPSNEELRAVDDEIHEMPNLQGDFGPYVQSLRLARYREVAEQLIASGHAFRCDCSPEQLAEERKLQEQNKETPGYRGRCRDRNVPADKPHIVRFRMPENPQVSLEDGIRGTITWESIPLRDPILMKSDAFPTYHLAVVVDDHDMRISHAMRGEEWIPSAPLHVLLYQALGWQMPIFCHLPVVLGADGKKLSKRHGATSWSSFRDDGYLPEAVLNFIVRIGWSPGDGDDQEIFSKEELIERFSLDRVNSSSGVFDYDKLNWMNGTYLRALSLDEFTERASDWIRQGGMDPGSPEWQIIGPHIQERAKTFKEIPELLEFARRDGFEPQLSQLFSKKLDKDLATRILRASQERLASLSDFTAAGLERELEDQATALSEKAGPVFLSHRIAVLGKKATPPLCESMQALGRDEVLRRLSLSLERIAGFPG